MSEHEYHFTHSLTFSVKENQGQVHYQTLRILIFLNEHLTSLYVSNSGEKKPWDIKINKLLSRLYRD